MEAEFVEDLASLCNTDVHAFQEASTVLTLLVESISGDIHKLDDWSRQQCYQAFVSSNAYKLSVSESQAFMIEWLITVDKLQTEQLYVLGKLFYQDRAELGKRCIPRQKEVVQAVVDAVWMYRFTNQDIVATYLSISYQICVQSELSEETSDQCATTQFVLFSYRKVADHAEDSIRETMLAIVGLNDQFMLHDKRGEANRVFNVFHQSPREYISIGSVLVWMFNRCKDSDQDSKIFICKFLYLMFTTPNTSDLLYTNDLTVLIEILIRELHDLAIEAVEVRAMYSRVLHAILTHSTMEVTQAQLKNGVVHALKLTVDNADVLTDCDREEITRLAKRCLNVEWLNSSGVQPNDSNPDCSEQGTVGSVKLAPTSCTEPEPAVQFKSGSYAETDSPKAAIPRPPPPRVPHPRNSSVASIESSDSKQSIMAIEQVGRGYSLRPPPPPPPPPPPSASSIPSISASPPHLPRVRSPIPPPPPPTPLSSRPPLPSRPSPAPRSSSTYGSETCLRPPPPPPRPRSRNTLLRGENPF